MKNSVWNTFFGGVLGGNCQIFFFKYLNHKSFSSVNQRCGTLWDTAVLHNSFEDRLTAAGGLVQTRIQNVLLALALYKEIRNNINRGDFQLEISCRKSWQLFKSKFQLKNKIIKIWTDVHVFYSVTSHLGQVVKTAPFVGLLEINSVNNS